MCSHEKADRHSLLCCSNEQRSSFFLLNGEKVSVNSYLNVFSLRLWLYGLASLTAFSEIENQSDLLLSFLIAILHNIYTYMSWYYPLLLSF